MSLNSSRQRGTALGKTAAALAIAGIAAAGTPAWAVLGEQMDAASSSAAASTTVMRAATAGSSAAYSVSTSTLPTGTVVNEYAAPAGKVFAVSWRGQMPPDLSQLLGSYYPSYQTALAARPSGVRNRHVLLNSGGMVFVAGGHMRDLRGIAYVPALMPQGLSAGDLK